MDADNWLAFAALAVTVLCGVWHLAQKVNRIEMRQDHQDKRGAIHGKRIRALEAKVGITPEETSDTIPFPNTGTDQ